MIFGIIALTIDFVSIATVPLICCTDLVENDVQVANVVVFGKLIWVTHKDSLGIIGANHIQGNIGIHEHGGAISDQSNRRGVDQNIVVRGFQLVEKVKHALRQNKF